MTTTRFSVPLGVNRTCPRRALTYRHEAVLTTVRGVMGKLYLLSKLWTRVVEVCHWCGSCVDSDVTDSKGVG